MSSVKNSITKEHINKLKKDIGFRDNVILEKVIHAYVLLAELVKEIPDLIFKGGTSISFQRFPPKRFSIDIDIIVDWDLNGKIHENLESVIKGSPVFNKVQRDRRKDRKYIEHYKFYYNSLFVDWDEYVLLDILYAKNTYHKINKVNLDLPLIKLEDSIEVNVPTFEGLYADKLVAIADNALGIQINKKFEMQYVKQVIDLLILYENIYNMEDIIRTFKNIVELECGLHKKKISYEETTKSIQNIALKFAHYRLKGWVDNDSKVSHIVNGLRTVKNHLIAKYTADNLKESFSKAAYIANLIDHNDSSMKIEKISNPPDDYRFTFPKDYKILNTLFKSNLRAYYYLSKLFI
jgi:hypothetical protein